MQPINPASSFVPIPKDGITPPTVEQQQAQLKTQVEEFASILYSQMFQEMREAGKVSDDDENSVFGGGDTDYFMHFLDESVGHNFVKQGGNSLGDALYRQLSGRLSSQAQGGGQ